MNPSGGDQICFAKGPHSQQDSNKMFVSLDMHSFAWDTIPSQSLKLCYEFPHLVDTFYNLQFNLSIYQALKTADWRQIMHNVILSAFRIITVAGR